MVADTLYPLTLPSPCILQGVVVADTLYPLTLPIAPASYRVHVGVVLTLLQPGALF